MSLLAQTHPAAEVVIVSDGPVSAAVEEVVSTFSDAYPRLTPAHSAVTLVQLPQNQGAAYAFQAGVEQAHHDVIARLDSDDAAAPERFAVQFSTLVASPQITALGTALMEVHNSAITTLPAPRWEEVTRASMDAWHNLPQSLRTLPRTHDQLRRYVAINSPLNHPSVMVRKAPVLEVGGYVPAGQTPVPFMEDYDLWARLLAAGRVLHNLEEPLTFFRTSDAMFERRTGQHMLAAEWQLQRNLARYGLVSHPRAALNVGWRSAYRALPKSMLRKVYARAFTEPFDKR